MSFEQLKNNRAELFNKIRDQVDEDDGSRKSYDDPRFWRPVADKTTGNAYALIRFLPSKNPETSYVKYYSFGAKGPNGWYIENSLRSIGKTDPMAEENARLWATGDEANQKIVRDRRQRTHYVSNILVIDDKQNPENNGNVMLYRYGKKIFSLLKDAMSPTFKEDPVINPFDMWEGADFALRVHTVQNFLNYDKSGFQPKSALLGGDETALLGVYNQVYDLFEFVNPENQTMYKSYAALKQRMRIVGLIEGGDMEGGAADVDSLPTSAGWETEDTVGDIPWSAPQNQAPQNQAPQAPAQPASAPEQPPAPEGEGDYQQTLEKFRKLAEGKGDL